MSAGTRTAVQADGNMSGAGVSPGTQQNRPCPARGRRRLRLSATCVNAGWRCRRSEIPALFHFFFFKETILGRFIFFSNGKPRVFNVSSFVCARCLPRGAKRCSRRGVEHTPVPLASRVLSGDARGPSARLVAGPVPGVWSARAAVTSMVRLCVVRRKNKRGIINGEDSLGRSSCRLSRWRLF